MYKSGKFKWNGISILMGFFLCTAIAYLTGNFEPQLYVGVVDSSKSKSWTGVVDSCNEIIRFIELSSLNNGQLISKLLFDVLNFPKKQNKKLTNFCPKV